MSTTAHLSWELPVERPKKRIIETKWQLARWPPTRARSEPEGCFVPCYVDHCLSRCFFGCHLFCFHAIHHQHWQHHLCSRIAGSSLPKFHECDWL